MTTFFTYINFDKFRQVISFSENLTQWQLNYGIEWFALMSNPPWMYRPNRGVDWVHPVHHSTVNSATRVQTLFNAFELSIKALLTSLICVFLFFDNQSQEVPKVHYLP